MCLNIWDSSRNSGQIFIKFGWYWRVLTDRFLFWLKSGKNNTIFTWRIHSFLCASFKFNSLDIYLDDKCLEQKLYLNNQTEQTRQNYLTLLTCPNFKRSMFFNVTPCSPAGFYDTCSVYFHGRRVNQDTVGCCLLFGWLTSSTPKSEAVRPSATSSNFYQTTRNHIPVSAIGTSDQHTYCRMLPR
jgi:hypothetical protein